MASPILKQHSVDDNIEHTHEDHHVHFSNDTDDLKENHENHIVVRKRGHNHFEVHLGFLQVFHTYEVCVDLKDKDVDPSLELETFGQKELPVPVHVKFQDLEETEDGPLLKFVFKALHDKVTKEKMYLTNKDGDELQFEVIARVLGKGKGTPLLRSGINCTSVEKSDETEGSDWRGF